MAHQNKIYALAEKNAKTQKEIDEASVKEFDFHKENVGTSSMELILNIKGFEGPIDMLLHLARKQKVDLSEISVLHIVKQYLSFIDRAKKLRVELAADYLVMAAWLAFLKSKLLLPVVEEEDEVGAELAEHLQFRLKQLESMRHAAKNLFERPKLGVEVFARAEPEGVVINKQKEFEASLYDLLNAYADQAQRNQKISYEIKKREVWSITDVRTKLDGKMTEILDWESLDLLLDQFKTSPDLDETVTASGFGAMLEYAKEGIIDLKQSEHFSPIYLKSRSELNYSI